MKFEKGIVMKEKEYPLICDACKKSELVSERKIYEITITEITLNRENDNDDIYSEGCSKKLQVCKECFDNSDLNRILENQHRTFVIG